MLFLFIIPFVSFSQIISFELIESYSINDVQDIYTFSSIPPYAGEINYAVDGFKIYYYTRDHSGSEVIASGAIFVPSNSSCPSPIISWQHGTIVSDTSAPSQQINDENFIGVLAASHGYIVLMSDYLGLGEGDGIHNYCHSETEASSVIDLIVSSFDFYDLQNIEHNNQLFLMGYSQGGHATLASVKELEENWEESISVTASCPMAGPYSMSEVQSAMLTEVYPNPGYFPYVIFSYQNVYGNIYNNPSDIFKSGYENLIELYNGSFSMDNINEEIWLIAQNLYGISPSEFRPVDMIKDDYYSDFLSNELHPFRLALLDNDLINFIPQSPMRLIHCNGDDNVPYQNSIMAFDAFSPYVSEELVLLDGGNFNHSECALMSIISAKLYFDTLAQFCKNVELFNPNLFESKIIKRLNLLGQSVYLGSNNTLTLEIYDNGNVKKNIQIQ